MKPFREQSHDSWDRVIAITLLGVFHCMRAEIIAMLGSGGGAIVNNASVAGIVGFSTIAPYSAAKHGVIGLTRTAALEYAGRGIRINAICPGYMDTPMMHAFTTLETRQAHAASSPAGRLALFTRRQFCTWRFHPGRRRSNCRLTYPRVASQDLTELGRRLDTARPRQPWHFSNRRA